MDPNKKTTNSKGLPYWAVDLRKACLTAEKLHAKREEIKVLKHSKRIIKDRDLRFDQCPGVLKKIRLEIADKESSVKDIKEKLNSRENRFLKEFNKMLESAADIIGVMESQGISTSAESPFFDPKYYTDQMKELESKIETLESQKLDKVDYENILRNLIKDTEKDLKKQLEESEISVKSDLQRIDSELEDKGKELQKLLSDESVSLMTERILKKMLGLEDQKSMTVEDIPSFVQDYVRDHLQETFAQMLMNINRPTSTLYPPSIVSNNKNTGHNNRLKKSKYKVSRMNKESDEALSLFEANLQSWPVQNVFKNLDHIDRVTRSHKEILDFINAPTGYSNTPLRYTFADEDDRSVKYNGLENIPPQISLFMDKRLSNALATSLAEYTDKLYFSDLKQRVEELEKKL